MHYSSVELLILSSWITLWRMSGNSKYYVSVATFFYKLLLTGSGQKFLDCHILVLIAFHTTITVFRCVCARVDHSKSHKNRCMLCATMAHWTTTTTAAIIASNCGRAELYWLVITPFSEAITLPFFRCRRFFPSHFPFLEIQFLLLFFYGKKLINRRKPCL